MIIEKSFIKEINFFIYKKKHLIIYIFIGVLSLLFELIIRQLLIKFFGDKSLLLHSAIFFGVIFAFYFNIKFNFNVPKLYLTKSLIYFIIISFVAYIVQFSVKRYVDFGTLSYSQTRFLISGIFFLIGYFFHLKFSFKDTIKVGVAIYANGYENIKKIYEEIGPYPDFIHVDITDKTMFKEVLKRTGQVIIMIRDTSGTDDSNPFDFETVKKNIESNLTEYEGKFEVIKVPNITNICYGRGVGYEIEQISLSKEIEEISATKIRKKMKI